MSSRIVIASCLALLAVACGDDDVVSESPPPPPPGGDAGAGVDATTPPGRDGSTPSPGTDAATPPDPFVGECALPAPIDEGVTYERTLYVAPSGDDGNDGSMASPYRTIGAAARAATAGTQVRVAAGTYPAFRADGLAGEPGRPIAITADGEAVIDGGGEVPISMSDPAYVVIDGFTLTGAGIHGMNISDGGSYDTPGHHLVLRGLTIRSAGSGGNNDCIKLSGIDDFWVLGSDVSGCDRGEIIDMVGCHRGVISGNYFHDTVQSGVQTKGGSSDTVIHGNVFENIPGRAVNAGGSTGEPYYRPIDATAEAARISVLGNVFVGNGAEGGAAIAFVGCDACLFAHNTIIEPRTWVVRILQESTDARFVPSRDGRFVNNVIVFRSADLRTFVNVGGGTAPDTFTFGTNLWYALDDPGFSGPSYSDGIPPEDGSMIQVDPRLADPSGGDYRPTESSPFGGAGRDVGDLPPDFDGRCFASPAALGAFEMP